MTDHLTSKEIMHILKSEVKPVFAIFSAEGWCKPCRTIKPAIERLSKTFKNIIIIKIDADACPDLMEMYEIVTVPCLKVFVNYEVKDEILNGLTEDNLIAMSIKYAAINM